VFGASTRSSAMFRRRRQRPQTPASMGGTVRSKDVARTAKAATAFTG